MNAYEKLSKELEIAKQRAKIKEKEWIEAKDEQAEIEQKIMELLLNGEKPEKKVITLPEETIHILLKDIRKKRFATDGCNCGTYAMQINDDMGIYVYRSCYKSSSTPNEKMWEVHKIVFYKKIKPIMEKYNNKEYVTDYEVEEELPMELNEAQENRLKTRLKRVSRVQTDQTEYRNDY